MQGKGFDLQELILHSQGLGVRWTVWGIQCSHEHDRALDILNHCANLGPWVWAMIVLLLQSSHIVEL